MGIFAQGHGSERAPLTSLFVSLLLLLPGASARAEGTNQDSIVGWYYWDLRNAPLQILLKVSRDPHGRITATCDNLARGEHDRPVSAVFYRPPEFRFELDSSSLIDGQVAPGGKTLEAAYKAGDMVFPFTLSRVAPSEFPPEPELSYAAATEGAGRLCGYWNGTMEWQNAKLRHVLRIGSGPGGRLYGKLDMLDQGERDLPLTGMHLTNREARIECKSWEIVYSGSLSDDGQHLKMRFESGTKSAAINFEHASVPWQLETWTSPAAARIEPARSVEGEWHGVLDMQSTYGLMEVKVARRQDGTWQVLQRSPEDPRLIAMPALNATFSDPELKCEWLGSGFSKMQLRARLSPQADQLTGTLEADGSIMPVLLDRAKPGAARRTALR